MLRWPRMLERCQVEEGGMVILRHSVWVCFGHFDVCGSDEYVWTRGMDVLDIAGGVVRRWVGVDKYSKALPNDSMVISIRSGLAVHFVRQHYFCITV